MQKECKELWPRLKKSALFSKLLIRRTLAKIEEERTFFKASNAKNVGQDWKKSALFSKLLVQRLTKTGTVVATFDCKPLRSARALFSLFLSLFSQLRLLFVWACFFGGCINCDWWEKMPHDSFCEACTTQIFGSRGTSYRSEGQRQGKAWQGFGHWLWPPTAWKNSLTLKLPWADHMCNKVE